MLIILWFAGIRPERALRKEVLPLPVPPATIRESSLCTQSQIVAATSGLIVLLLIRFVTVQGFLENFLIVRVFP